MSQSAVTYFLLEILGSSRIVSPLKQAELFNVAKSTLVRRLIDVVDQVSR